MIVSLASDAVRHDDEVARLRAHLRRAPGNLAHHAVLSADRHPVADAERLLDLNGEPGEQIAERVLQRQPDDDRADRGRRHHAIAKDQRRDEREQRDDERVLDDVGKALGDPIGAPGIDASARRAG